MEARVQRVETESENVIPVPASLGRANSARRPASRVNLAGEEAIVVQSIC